MCFVSNWSNNRFWLVADHESCSPEMDDNPIDSTDPNLSFCGHNCLQVY